MKTWQTLVAPALLGGSAFGLGSLSTQLENPSVEPICIEQSYQETSIVSFESLSGDLLKASVSGPVRLVWNEQFVEGDGLHDIPLGQFYNQEDKKFLDFAYVGNAGTYKFYPADTYAARGTHPSKRRFFASREAAEAAGFVASKLVK